MKFIRFGSLLFFKCWFNRTGRFENYPLIDLNYYRCIEDDTVIYRLVQGGKDIGIAFVSNIHEDDIWIDLFEISEKYRGKGYGTKMVDMIVDIYKPKRIHIQCAGDHGKRKGDAYKFWKGRGFHIDWTLTTKDGDLFMIKRFPKDKRK